MAEEASSSWQAWEPQEWLDARGAVDGIGALESFSSHPRSAYTFGWEEEGVHFVVRWGAQRRSFSEGDAVTLLGWLERAWSLLCDELSPKCFLCPYSTPGWSADGRLRKLNVYITGTGLAPHPGDAAWAHQGTHVERGLVHHPLSNPEGLLHHSYLALKEEAAKSESTVCHELTHVLQMHSGGHVGSNEAHAEYVVHLCQPTRRDWAHGLDAFLASAHLPPGATRCADGAADGRQYVVWPFLAWLDRRFGSRTAHGLWAADWEQRCAGDGRSRDPLTNLAARLGGWAQLRLAFGDWACAVATARFGADASADAAVRAACDVLAPARLSRLRPFEDGWRSDRAKPLKQHGVSVHRLTIPTGGVVEARVTGDSALTFALVALNASTGERVESEAAFAGQGAARLELPTASLWYSSAAAAGASGWALLLAVSAAPDEPQPVPWGVEPSSLRTFFYTVRLFGCEPHPHSRAPADPLLLRPPQADVLLACVGLPQDTPLTRALVSGGGAPSRIAAASGVGSDVCMPTRMDGWEMCVQQPGASLTDVDLRSGEPGCTTVAWLRSGLGGFGQGSRISRARFSFRYVVGYSGNLGSPGPRFELVAASLGDDLMQGDGTPFVSVLYASPEFDARPFHYDTCAGGHPHNYSPPIVVDAACNVLVPEAGLRLGLRFVNGVRNVHVQGGGWPNSLPLDLELTLTVEYALTA